MKNYNYTPRPWVLRSGDQDNFHEIIGPYQSNKTICILPKYQFVTNVEAQANGQLIAAVPELLDALREVLGMCQYPYKDMETYKQAQRAIMKATGCSIEQTIPNVSIPAL